MQKKIFYSLLLITAAGIIFLWQFKNSHAPVLEDKKKITATHYANFSNAEFYTGLTNPPAYEERKEKVYAGIISHHFFAEREISKMLLSVKRQNFSTIVIVGPNHFNRGAGGIIISKLGYSTPFGVLENNFEITNKLLSSGLVSLEEKPFELEHSVSAVVGFVKNIFPNTKITPIIISRNFDLEESRHLGKYLAENLPQDSLVLGSVDFSHHFDLKTTEANDEASKKVLLEKDFEGLRNIEADSRQSLAVVMEYAKQKQAQNFEFTNTNSARLSNNLESKDVTSYFFGYYVK